MSSRHNRRRQRLQGSEAAVFLRGIADAVEHGQIALDGGMLPLEGPVELMERHRPSKRKLKIDLRIRLVAAPGLLAGPPAAREHEPSPPPPSAPRYKQLKKRMKQDFRQLHKAAHAGTVDVELARRFHVACRQMTGFPGKGDPHYPAWTARRTRCCRRPRLAT